MGTIQRFPTLVVSLEPVSLWHIFQAHSGDSGNGAVFFLQGIHAGVLWMALVKFINKIKPLLLQPMPKLSKLLKGKLGVCYDNLKFPERNLFEQKQWL